MLPKHIRQFKTIFENQYQTLYHVHADFESISRDYYVTSYGARAGVMVFRGRNVLLTRQYRLLINDYSLEIPGGKIEEGELPENAAIRECLEETGILCSKLEHLVTYQPGIDTMYNPTYVFFARDSEDVDRNKYLENGEVAGYQWVDFDKCVDMVTTGEIPDILTMVAVHTYLHAGGPGKDKSSKRGVMNAGF